MTNASERKRKEPNGRSAAGSKDTLRKDDFNRELISHLPHLRHYALALTGNATEASDLVQDSVLKALEKRHQFSEGTYMRRWLFTILRNSYVDNCRQKARRGPHVTVEDCSPRTLRHPASQDDWMELKHCESRIRALGACDRSILLLSVFSPLSHKEIADRLGVAEGTIRSRLSRTRTQLRA